jgi:hypothetical protein
MNYIWNYCQNWTEITINAIIVIVGYSQVKEAKIEDKYKFEDKILIPVLEGKYGKEYLYKTKNVKYINVY